MFFLPTPFDRDTAQKNRWLWGSRSPERYYLWTPLNPSMFKVGNTSQNGGHGPCFWPQQIFWSGAVARFISVLPPSLDPQLNPSEIFPWGDPGCLVVLGPGEFWIFWIHFLGKPVPRGGGWLCPHEWTGFVRFRKESLVMVAWPGTSS